jgi:para-aminobenzoate synthetase
MPDRLEPGSLAAACSSIAQAVTGILEQRRPVVVALDGGSGAGKSSLAASLAEALDAVIVPQDDFYSGRIPQREWEVRSAADRCRDVIDWARVRAEALDPLRAGHAARWHPLDFEAGPGGDGTYALSSRIIERHPASVIILDGAYSASPALADLVDLTVLVDVPLAERHRRLAAREDPTFLRQWHALWDAAEAYYFGRVRPASAFDLVVTLAGR